MPKYCLQCKKEFYKKINYSKKYWEGAKYCSYICSRAGLPLPRKRQPNEVVINGDVVEMYIKKKGICHSVFIDNDDYQKEDIKNFAWHLSQSGYPTRRMWWNGKYRCRFLHQFILDKKDGFVVDHIDRNPKNNTKENLRYLTHQNNIRNSSIRNKTGIVGGYFTKNGKIRVVIKVDVGKTKVVGTFSSKEDAYVARIEAEKMYWGNSFHD